MHERDRRARRRGLASSSSRSRWAQELITGFARLDGRAVGIVANQPKCKGGVLFVDSADKAARFIWLCDAFNIPLLFLADVPGLHDRHRGRAAGHHPPRRQDDLRGQRGDGAEDLRDRAQGLRRRPVRDVRARPSIPTRRSRCPSATIAVMGAEAAVNAVFYNKIAGDRGRGRARGQVAPSSGASTPRRRPPAPRGGAGRRRGGPAGGPARASSCGGSRATPAGGATGRPSATASRRSEASLAAAGQKAGADEVALLLMRVAALLEGGGDEL